MALMGMGILEPRHQPNRVFCAGAFFRTNSDRVDEDLGAPMDEESERQQRFFGHLLGVTIGFAAMVVAIAVAQYWAMMGSATARSWAATLRCLKSWLFPE